MSDEGNLKTILKTYILQSFNLEVSFLDLQNKIENGNFLVGLLDDFPFSNVRMPYKSSNLPSNMSCAAKGTETSCIAKANNNVDFFYSFVKPLIFSMIKQDTHNDKLPNASKTFLSRHQIYFKHKAQDLQDLLSSIFQ